MVVGKNWVSWGEVSLPNGIPSIPESGQDGVAAWTIASDGLGLGSAGSGENVHVG